MRATCKETAWGRAEIHGGAAPSDEWNIRPLGARKRTRGLWVPIVNYREVSSKGAPVWEFFDLEWQPIWPGVKRPCEIHQLFQRTRYAILRDWTVLRSGNQHYQGFHGFRGNQFFEVWLCKRRAESTKCVEHVDEYIVGAEGIARATVGILGEICVG